MITDWKCDVCKHRRADSRISVFKKDASSFYKMPAGTVIMNVKYCNDREDCKAEAKAKGFFNHNNKGEPR